MKKAHMSTRRFGGEVYRGRRGSRMRGFAVSGSRAWRPTDIAGCTLWLDPSDAATLTKETGGRVTAWADKSASEYVLTAASGSGARPYSEGVTINGRAALLAASGPIQALNAPITNASTGEVTVFAIVKQSDPSVRTYQNFLSMDSGSDNRVALSMLFGANICRTWVWTSGGDLRQSATLTYSSTDPVLWTAQMWAGYATLQYNNGMSIEAGSVNPKPKYSASAALNVFCKYDGVNDLFAGSAGEIIAYDRKLGSSDLKTVKNYLADKWGIAHITDSSKVEDSFNRADGLLGTADTGQTWSVVSGTWAISSNKAVQTASVAGIAVVELGGKDAYAEAVMSGTFGGNAVGIFVRADSSGNGYCGVVWGSNCQLYKRVGGTFTSIAASQGVTTSSGDVWRMEVLGNWVTLYQNGTKRTAVEDTSISAGNYVGLYKYSTDSFQFDDFDAQTIQAV